MLTTIPIVLQLLRNFTIMSQRLHMNTEQLDDLQRCGTPEFALGVGNTVTGSS